MIRHYLCKAALFFFNFFYLQLFLTVLSWPIMLWWGLPLSKAAFVGNLIFNPFLMLFLLISSLIFVCALLNLPHMWLTYTLDLLTKLWLSIASYASPRWLLGAPKPSLFITLIIITGTLTIMYTRLLRTALQKCGALFIFFLCALMFLEWWYVPTQAHYTVRCGKNNTHLIINEKKPFLIIKERLGPQVNLNSWVEYTLLPFLIQKTGRVIFEAVIIHNDCPQKPELLKSLALYHATKTVFLPENTPTPERQTARDSLSSSMEVKFYSRTTPPPLVQHLLDLLQTHTQKCGKNKREKNKSKEKHEKTSSTCYSA